MNNWTQQSVSIKLPGSWQTRPFFFKCNNLHWANSFSPLNLLFPWMSEAIFSFPSLRSKRFRSIGLSAGLKHFSLFERAKIGARAKKMQQCCARPNLRAAKKGKMPRTGGKTSETLATQAIDFPVQPLVRLISIFFTRSGRGFRYTVRGPLFWGSVPYIWL